MRTMRAALDVARFVAWAALSAARDGARAVIDGVKDAVDEAFREHVRKCDTCKGAS